MSDKNDRSPADLGIQAAKEDAAKADKRKKALDFAKKTLSRLSLTLNKKTVSNMEIKSMSLGDLFHNIDANKETIRRLQNLHKALLDGSLPAPIDGSVAVEINRLGILDVINLLEYQNQELSREVILRCPQYA